MKSHWIRHRERKIFYVDFSNFLLNREPFKAELEAVSGVVCQEPEATVLGLVDLRNTVLTMAMTEIIKGYARRMGRHINKAAVIVNKNTGARRYLLNAIARVGGRQVVLFETVEEAKDWLVENQPG